MNNTIVVLGAGVAGLTAAAELRAVLPSREHVVLVDRDFTGSLGLSRLWVWRGWRATADVTVRPDQSVLGGITPVTAQVDRIDTAARTVDTSLEEPIRYDALVVALGAQADAARLPGLHEALRADSAEQFYSLDGAERLHQRVASTRKGRIVVLVGATPYPCPAAPFEAAFLIADQLREQGVDDAVRVDVFTPDPLPMPVAGREVGEALVNMLQAGDIGFHGGLTPTHVDHGRQLIAFDDGTQESFDLLAAVPPHSPPAVVAALDAPDQSGWIRVDPHTMTTDIPGVWAVGDATVLTLPNSRPLPKAAVFAEAQAEVAAHQIAQYLGHEAPDTQFAGDGSCYIEVGAGLAAKGAGQFFASPSPEVTLYEPAADHHAEKEQQERDWVNRWNSRS